MSARFFSAVIAFTALFAGCSDDDSPTSPVSSTHDVSWDAGHVSLQADDFYIEVGGVKYVANVETIDVDGDPGSDDYQSLELEWGENGTTMRLYIYLQASGGEWWSDEIRTYDGSDDGEWIYYYGEFFKSPLGTSFDGNIDLTSSESDSDIDGKLHFTGLRLTAFL